MINKVANIQTLNTSLESNGGRWDENICAETCFVVQFTELRKLSEKTGIWYSQVLLVQL